MFLTAQRGALGALCAASLVTTACQSYEARPLDAQGHVQAWAARAPSSQEVRDFADALVAGGHTPADAFDPGNGLTVDEAEVVALVYNADLRLARARAGVALAEAEFAGLWEDPRLEFDVLRVLQDVPSPWVIPVGLSFTLPISGRLEAEQARADASVHEELKRVHEHEWRVRRDVRIAWAHWSGQRLKLEQTLMLVEQLESIVGSTQELARLGEMPRPEAALFALELGTRRAESYRLEADVERAALSLLRLMGLTPLAPVELHPSLTVYADINEPAVADIAQTNLTLVRLRAEYEVAERVLAREIRKQYPDLTIGPAFEADQGQSRIGIIGGLPIPVLNANKQGIAQARATRELARAAFETGLEQAVHALANARVELEAASAQREEIAVTLVPLVDQQLGDAQQLLELGESGGLVLLESFVRAHDIKIQLVEVREDESVAASELAFLRGPLRAQTDTNNDPEVEG